MRDLIGNPMDKRRAERFHELLIESEGGRRRHKSTDYDDDLAQLVNVGSALTETARSMNDATGPRPEFSDALRKRLMAVATVQGIGAAAAPADVPKAVVAGQPRGRRRFVLAVTLAVGVFGLTGVSSASGDAIPGDALYPVKRSTEHAQLALAGSDVNRGELHFEFAETRLAEATQIVEDSVAVSDALSDMDDDLLWGMQELTSAAVERQDESILDTIDAFLVPHHDEVRSLADALSGKALADADESVTLVESAISRSEQLRDVLSCTDIDKVDTDEFGPVPPKGCEVDDPASGGRPPADGPDTPVGGDPAPGGSTEPSADEPRPSDPASPSPQQPEDVPEDEPESNGGLLSELGDLLSGIFG